MEDRGARDRHVVHPTVPLGTAVVGPDDVVL